MKSTEKYVEIMEKLTGAAIGSQVTFNKNTYKLTDIKTDDLEATVTLAAEGQDDISITLKSLIESTEYVIEKKACEEEEEDDKETDKDEEDKDKEKVEEEEEEDEEDKDKEKVEEEEEEDDKEEEEEEDKKAMKEKSKK